MSGPDPISLIALFISLIALILTLLQLAQQFVATANDYRHCSKRTVGGWSKGSSRRFIWNELRFEVLFATPIISIDLRLPPCEGRDIYAVPTTRLDTQTSSEKTQASASSTNVTSNTVTVSSSGALYSAEGNQPCTAFQTPTPWFLDEKGTTPEAKCTWLSLLNDVSIAHLKIDIKERSLSYDFMPDGVKKPLAQMDRKSFLTLMSLFQVSWQEGGGKSTPTGAGPYCEVTSRNLVNFGTVISYHLSSNVRPTRFYIVNEKARQAMFNRFDLSFHVILTHSAEEVYKSVMGLAGEEEASAIRGYNEANNGWSPGLAEVIGCLAEPEMPKAIEHGRDEFVSIFSTRSTTCVLDDYPVIQILIGEKIENSTTDVEKISGWAKDFLDPSSHLPPHVDGVRLPTDRLLAGLQFACGFVKPKARLGEPISWSESRKALEIMKLLDKELRILCHLLAPTQPELEVHREFARLQVTYGYSLFEDTLTRSKQGGFWKDFIGPVVSSNYVKVCAGLEEKYPESEQKVRSSFIINRMMRAILWHVHNGNAPTEHERQLECSLNSRWLSDTSTIWID